MVNNATRYKLNNAHIGLCASRGRSQWTVFSFSQQIDPVVSIHTYSSLICTGAIFQEHGSRSQNVVWRKEKKRKKNQYKYICKRPQPYWSTYVKHFLKQRCVCLCACLQLCVLQGGRKKPPHESFLWKYGLNSEELSHWQPYILSIKSLPKTSAQIKYHNSFGVLQKIFSLSWRNKE